MAVGTTRNVRITINIADTEKARMTGTVNTSTMTMTGTDMNITGIGGHGNNGMLTQKDTRTYTSMEHITGKMRI